MRRPALRWFQCLIGFILVQTVCACSVLPPVCVPPAESMVRAELLFGRKIGGKVGVSEAAFAAFLAREVTPRFQDGLTVVDAKGQWRDRKRGNIVREPSKLLLLVFRDEPSRRDALSAIVEAYKKQFKQQSVLLLVRGTCAAF